jgi:hypothetical protein
MNNILILALTGLLVTGMASCKKDDGKSNSTTTTTTSTTTTTNNPLISKECSGTGTITVNDVNDTIYTWERLSPKGTVKSFGVYAGGYERNSLMIFTGDSKLPASSKTFTILSDLDRFPVASEAAVSYHDYVSGEDFYATEGTVSYILTATEKIVKFSNIKFTVKDGTKTKMISFTVNMK